MRHERRAGQLPAGRATTRWAMLMRPLRSNPSASAGPSRVLVYTPDGKGRTATAVIGFFGSVFSLALAAIGLGTCPEIPYSYYLYLLYNFRHFVFVPGRGGCVDHPVWWCGTRKARQSYSCIYY